MIKPFFILTPVLCSLLLLVQPSCILGRTTEISPSVRELRRSEVTRLSEKRSELTPVKSYLRISEYYLKNNKPLKALEIYTFGLDQQPDNWELLSGLLKTSAELKKYRFALPYAEHFMTIAPDSREAFLYYSLINDGISKEAALEESKAKKAFNKPPGAEETTAAPTPATAAVTATAPTADVAEADKVSPLLNYSIEEKLKALQVLFAIDAAVKTFNLRNKEKPMEVLSIEKLTETGILPKDLKLTKWKDNLAITNGELEIKDIGTVSKLKEELKPFKDKIQKVRDYVQAGEHYEALNLIEELTELYPDMREIMYKRLFILISAKESVQSIKVATELRNKFKESPRPLFELIMVYYKLGNYEEAKVTADSLIQSFPKTHWAGLAEKVNELMSKNVSFNLLANIKEARQKHLTAKETSVTKKE